MCAFDRAWYLAVTLVGWAYFSDGSEGPRVLRRPSWAPVWCVRLVRQWHRLPVYGLMVLGLILATELVEVMWLRAAYFLCVFLADLVLYATYGMHTGFVLLYTSLAMVLPAGSVRSGSKGLMGIENCCLELGPARACFCFLPSQASCGSSWLISWAPRLSTSSASAGSPG